MGSGNGALYFLFLKKRSTFCPEIALDIIEESEESKMDRMYRRLKDARRGGMLED